MDAFKAQAAEQVEKVSTSAKASLPDQVDPMVDQASKAVTDAITGTKSAATGATTSAQDTLGGLMGKK